MSKNFIAEMMTDLNIELVDKEYRPGDRKIGGKHNQAWLKKTYLIDGKTQQQIAAECGCTQTSVWRAIQQIEECREEAQRRRQHRQGHSNGGGRTLTADQVIEARRCYKEGAASSDGMRDVTVSSMVPDYGVSHNALSSAINGATWTHVNHIEAPVKIERVTPNKQIDHNLLVWMHHHENKSMAEIADELSITRVKVKGSFAISGETVRSELSGNFDHTVYHFIHADGTDVHRTVHAMCQEFGLKPNSIYMLPRGDRQQLRGWALYKTTQQAGFHWGRGWHNRDERNNKFDPTERHWANKDDDRTYFGTTNGLFEFAPELKDVPTKSNIYRVTTGHNLSAYGWYLVNPPSRPEQPQTPAAIRNAKRRRNRTGQFIN